jgi:hypothetical protein
LLLVQYQLSPWTTARDLAASYPDSDRVSIVPPDGVAILQGQRIERFGFSMQLPWKDIYRDTALQDVALISSNSGGAIEIHPVSSRHDSSATMRLMADEVPALRDNQSLRNRPSEPANPLRVNNIDGAKRKAEIARNFRRFILTIGTSTRDTKSHR